MDCIPVAIFSIPGFGTGISNPGGITEFADRPILKLCGQKTAFLLHRLYPCYPSA